MSQPDLSLPSRIEGKVGSQAMLVELLEDLRGRYGARWEEQAIAGLSMFGLFIVVRLASGAQGLCFNYDVAQDVLPPVGGAALAEGLMGLVARGEKLLDSILYRRDGDCAFWEQGLSVAILSALSRPWLSPAALRQEGFQVERGRRSLSRMAPQARSVFIIGFGGYLQEALHTPQFRKVVCADYYFRWPARADFYRYRLQQMGSVAPATELVLTDGADTERHLRECDLIVITGSALSNGSMESLLAGIPEQATVVVEGLSATFLPRVYFRRHVDYVVQGVVDIDLHAMAQRYWDQSQAGEIDLGFGYYVDLLLPTFQTIAPRIETS